MKYHLSQGLVDKLKKIKSKDGELFRLIEKQLVLFENNENYPSLRNHKLSGGMKGYWSISINMKIRMVYLVEGAEAFFVNIGSHDELYRGN